MRSKTFTWCLVILILFGYQLLSAQEPFYLETFPSANAFNNNWTQGGVNPGPQTWRWNNNPAGVFNGQPPFASTTASNGFIIFNSDANGDVSHDVHVTSPSIDCSGRQQVFLRCENQYGFFSAGNVSIAEVGVSTDGTNFTYRRILSNVTRNNIADPVQVVVIELPEAANQASVFVRFRWQGRFEYLWRIDDVALYESDPTPSNNLRIDFPRIPSNFATPLSQAGDEAFVVIAENAGTLRQTNVEVAINIVRENNAVFSNTESLGTFAPMESDTVVFGESFKATDVGTYAYRYTISQEEEDAVPADNEISGNFIITNGLFSKENGGITGADQPGMVLGDFWEIGNVYSIFNGGDEAYQIDFSIASNNQVHIGRSATFFLYRVEDDGNATFNDDDLQIVGFGVHDFTPADSNFTLVSADIFSLENDETPGVPLSPGEYLLTVQLDPDMFMPTTTAFSYYYDFSTVVKNGNSWFLGGFGPDITALVRMRVRSTEPSSSREPQLADNQVNIFPNPAQNTLNVQLALQQASSNMQLRVFDATGKTVLLRQYEGMRDQTLQLDTNRWPAGAYFLHLRTDEGVTTRRFVVQN
ncbi:MAG TPA: T9SS type A sorting domain-containing protein [Saprospiraceae bacterium]|nr:T9SS type A sorting domain-containing protein [Saprospiraceae bacterium]HMP26177.1 T9SS type A sorting domain-containing protein [Saprospiraceae bacterium]